MVDQPQTKTGSIHQADGESRETDSKVQKVSWCQIGPVELVPNWSSRIGAKLVLLSTHKYWMALACAKLKIFKNESKSL
jgi:hypothetical protein